MHVYCSNLQIDYCNWIMIKVKQIKNIYDILSSLHSRDSKYEHAG